MSTASDDPLAAILGEAEANRRRDRAAANASGTVSVPASAGNYTVGDPAAGSPVLTDPAGKVDPALLYPAGMGETGATYTFEQPQPASVWTVHHQLNGYPNVVVRDDRGLQIIPEITPTDRNTTVIRFGRPTAGTADLSL